MLLVTALMGGLLAVLVRLPPMGAISLLGVLSLAACHVLGNSLGTRLRGLHAEQLPETEFPGRVPKQRHPVPPAILANTTQLRDRAPLHQMTRLATLCGAIAGGLVGAAGVWRILGDRLTISGLLLATVSSCVVGGFLGFMGGSFWEIFRGAWRQAARTNDHRANTL